MYRCICMQKESLHNKSLMGFKILRSWRDGIFFWGVGVDVGVDVDVDVDGGLFLSLNLLIIIWYILQV